MSRNRGGLNITIAALFFVLGSHQLVANANTINEQNAHRLTTEITDSRNTATEKNLAKRWGLSTADWQRYRSLMQGIRGAVSPATLSPIEVLGIHARNNNERRQYAEQWAMMMRDDAERILAFQQAYDEAQQRLYADTPLIDVDKLARFTANKKASISRTKKSPNNAPLDGQDRVLFFTATECPACDALLERLLSKLSQIAGLDVYFLNVASDDDELIRQWARLRKIKPEWVQSQRVTLNRDAGVLDKLSESIGLPQQKIDAQHSPVILRRRGDVLSPLSVYQF